MADAIDWNGSSLYDFGGPADELRQGLPPIVGDEGGSTWFAAGGHASAPLDLAVGPDFCFGLDLQPDHHEEQVVLGSERSGASAWRLTACPGNEPGTLSLLLRDEAGRCLEAVARGSEARARRVIFRVKPKDNLVVVSEIQPWAENPAQPLSVEIVRAESPEGIVIRDPLTIGGSSVDGTRQGSFRGRMAEFFINDKDLADDRIEALAAASTNPMGLTYRGLGASSSEFRNRFLRDLERLRHWCGKDLLSVNDLEDASLLLHRWLLDRVAILDVLTRRSGVQLWMPGPSDHAKQYLEAVLQDSPLIHVQGEVGPSAALGFQWVSLSDWRSEAAFHVRGAAVSREAFVKFVRNKLGPGHFDEEDRKRWQRELLEVTSRLRIMEHDAFSFQMRGLVKEVLLAVSIARAEALATGA